jgi:hypothetical protein
MVMLQPKVLSIYRTPCCCHHPRLHSCNSLTTLDMIVLPCQVWDVRRLERDVSFASRLTYAGQSGRITGVCAVLDGASVASASSSGSLHVWRVEYTGKPGGWAPDKYRGGSRAGCGQFASWTVDQDARVPFHRDGNDLFAISLDGVAHVLLPSAFVCALMSYVLSTCWQLLLDQQLSVGVVAAAPAAVGITALRQVSPGEGSIMATCPWGGHPALLLYATQRGGVHCIDLRCATDVWHVPPAPSLGEYHMMLLLLLVLGVPR